jgi:hypothetical protein
MLASQTRHLQDPEVGPGAGGVQSHGGDRPSLFLQLRGGQLLPAGHLSLRGHCEHALQIMIHLPPPSPLPPQCGRSSLHGWYKRLLTRTEGQAGTCVVCMYVGQEGNFFISVLKLSYTLMCERHYKSKVKFLS